MKNVFAKLPIWAKIAGGGAALVLVIFVGVAAHRGPDPVEVKTITLRPTTLTVKLPENGVVRLPETATLAAATNGVIVRIVAHEGQHVHAGDLLMKLDDRQIAAKVAADEAQLAQARATLEKAQQLRSVSGNASVQSVAQAQQTLLAAQAQLQADINAKREGQVSVAGASSLGLSGQAQLVQQQNQVAVAAANLRTARQTYESDKELYKINGIARQQLDRDEAAYLAAQANYDSAKRQLELTQVQLRDNAGQMDQRIQADRQAVQSARAALATAQTQSHQDKNVDVQSGMAGVSSAQAQLDYDRQQLLDTEVRAPFDGVVQTLGTATGAGGATPLAVGDAVTAGEVLFTFAGNAAMVVKAQVDEQDIGSVRVGQRVDISGSDFPGHHLPGTISRISPVVVTANQAGNAAKNVETTITLPRTYPFLRDGMSCDVDIITGEAKNALVVPQTAVADENGKHYVYVVDGKKVRRVEVRLGLRSDTDVVLASGVRRGDVIATTNANKLKDGAVVNASAASPAPSPTSS